MLAGGCSGWPANGDGPWGLEWRGGSSASGVLRGGLAEAGRPRGGPPAEAGGTSYTHQRGCCGHIPNSLTRFLRAGWWQRRRAACGYDCEMLDQELVSLGAPEPTAGQVWREGVAGGSAACMVAAVGVAPCAMMLRERCAWWEAPAAGRRHAYAAKETRCGRVWPSAAPGAGGAVRCSVGCGGHCLAAGLRRSRQRRQALQSITNTKRVSVEGVALSSGGHALCSPRECGMRCSTRLSKNVDAGACMCSEHGRHSALMHSPPRESGLGWLGDVDMSDISVLRGGSPGF